MSVELALALSRIGKPRVLVVGDYIYDADAQVEPHRFAQEAAHCPVWKRASKTKSRAGGAGAVEEMAAALGADVILASDLTQAASKHRYFVGDTQVLRIDYDAAPIPQADTDRIAAHVADEVQRADCVLIADYGKGVCTDAVLRSAIDGAKARGIPCIVDPHEHEWFRYEGATCLKMNAKQAKAQPKPLEACVTFPAIVITRGHEGISLGTHENQDEDYAVRPRNVVCVIGAGDMVLAALGVCVSGGMSWPDACKVANAAAGLKCERHGAVPVPRHEVIVDLLHGHKIIPAELLPAVSASRKAAWSNGCYDNFHAGHLHLLTEAKKQGDVLIVGVNTDESVYSLKGPGRPIRPFAERAGMVAALACVDYVVGVESEIHLDSCIKAVAPDVLVKGSDWHGKPITGAEYADRVHYVERIPGISTTELAR